MGAAGGSSAGAPEDEIGVLGGIFVTDMLIFHSPGPSPDVCSRLLFRERNP
jgi:hypothetical protein